MGRRSERLSKQGMLASDLAGEGDVIQVVSRAFDVLRCFEGHDARLGNLRNFQPLRPAALDRIAAHAHADADGPARLSARVIRSTASARARWR